MAAWNLSCIKSWKRFEKVCLRCVNWVALQAPVSEALFYTWKAIGVKQLHQSHQGHWVRSIWIYNSILCSGTNGCSNARTFVWRKTFEGSCERSVIFDLCFIYTKYSRLTTLARTILYISFSSTPSERIFSTAGNIDTKKKATPTVDPANMQNILPKNWKFFN